MSNYTKPFDNRLQYLVIGKNRGERVFDTRLPMDGDKMDTDVYTFLMPIDTLRDNIRDRVAIDASNNSISEDGTVTIRYNTGRTVERSNDMGDKTDVPLYETKTFNINDLIDKQQQAIDRASNSYINKTMHSIMNPYAMIHLSGGIDNNSQNRLIDDASRAPWYETVEGEDRFSKNPTTEKIIDWGKRDYKARTPYLFQDFVFCKWWNKVPNNRMITLRRYPNPVLDNLNTPVDFTSSNETIMFPPIATAVTYFGDDTGNDLKSILKFSTGVPWGEAKAEVWDLTSTTQPSTNEVYEGAFSGLGLGLGSHLATISNALGVLSGGDVGDGLSERNGVPPDPYKDGPYTNRIQGIVNRIDTVKKRDPGINFEMQNLKLKFDYVARPIGGINSKAIMLDILSNFLIMGSPTAQFFGGAHRSRIAGRRFPAQNDSALNALYKGKLFGENGAINEYGNKLNTFLSSAGGISGFLSSLWEAAKGLLGDLIGSFTGTTPTSLQADGQSANTMKEGVKKAITEKMRGGMPVAYVQGMRALLTGEPVGDWHLTIGNPLNPIAMIGNLICTNIEVEIDDEAGFGPDDFPLGWSITITLDHGMKRDRDAIESMFNFGNGRIYELPDKFGSSADDQTSVDDQTKRGTHSNKLQGDHNSVPHSPKSREGRVRGNPMAGAAANRKTITDFNENGWWSLLEENDDISIVNRIPTVYINDFVSKKSNR